MEPNIDQNNYKNEILKNHIDRISAPSTEQTVIQEVERLRGALEQNDLDTAVDTLEKIAQLDSKLPSEFLKLTAEAIRTQNWDLLSEAFISKQFVGPEGDVLLIAPYTVNRQAQQFTELSMLYGKEINHEHPLQTEIAKEALAKVDAIIVLPVEIISSHGTVYGEGGEAFIVPDGWNFDQSKDGPAINVMNEQRRRLLDTGLACLEKIFDPETYKLIAAIHDDKESAYKVQHLEYQFHEVGHATGITIGEKVDQDLLVTYWQRAVEEWRADCMAFSYMQKICSKEDLEKAIASNLATRFGVDAHRAGGLELDTDVNTTLLIFDRLMVSEQLYIVNGKLKLRASNYEELAAIYTKQIQDGNELTALESVLKHPQGVWGLYGQVGVSNINRAMFSHYVLSKCAGAFNSLK